MSLRLSLTGRPELVDAAGRSLRLPRKAFVLAAFLVFDAAKGRLPRERASHLLWEEADPARRAGNLRQLLARVREAQEAEGFRLFEIGTDHVDLVAEDVLIDAAVVLEAHAGAAGRALLDICKAYSGDLLLGLDEGGEAFTRWLWARRAMLREQFVDVVATDLEATLDVLDPEEVIFAARRLSEADPFQEVAYRVRMRIHAGRGEFATAQRIHRRLIEVLRETGGRPSPETSALVAEIVARAAPRGGRAPAAGEPADHEPAEGAPDAGSTGMPTPAIRTLQLPRLSLVFPSLADLPAEHREWAETLFDDAAIRLWRTRSFVLSRPTDVRTRPIDLIERRRREPCDYLVDFRLARRDGQPVLTTSLVASASGEIMWIHRYDFGEPVRRAARELVINCVHQIEQAELRALAAGPDQVTAYRLTLQGNRLLRSIDLPSIRRARQIFRAALAIDADHAPTLAALSKAYRLEWLRLARADEKELDLAIDFARQAIAAGPDGVHGLQQFGICNIYKKNYEQGLVALERAERQAPDQSEVVAEHADGLICYGSLADGLVKIRPILDETILADDQLLWNAASGHYLSGHYEETLGLLSRMSTEEPAFHLKAACFAMMSQLDEARRYVRKLREILPDFTIRKRLEMVPLRRREDLEHYEYGLRTAGFE